MKLAEALAERSDCQNRLEDIRKRMVRCARVQEGERPAEDTDELFKESERLFGRLLELISAINRTNSRTAFDGQLAISDAIAQRDVLGKKRDYLSSVTEAATTRQDRYSKSEVKFVTPFPVASLQKQIDQLSKQFRKVDTKIQELNWKTDLV